LNFRCQCTQQKLQSICAVLTFDPEHKKILTFSVKNRYRLNYFICIIDFNVETITSLKLNLFSFFICGCLHHQRKTICLYVYIFYIRQIVWYRTLYIKQLIKPMNLIVVSFIFVVVNSRGLAETEMFVDKLNLFSFFICGCLHHQRKTICLYVYIFYIRQIVWYRTPVFIQWFPWRLHITITYYLPHLRRCHSNSVNTGSRLPICSDIKTRKRLNVVGIDMIRNNRIVLIS
jgi:hypothetical protein